MGRAGRAARAGFLSGALAVGAAFGGGAPAWAQASDPAHLEKAERLYGVIVEDGLVEQILDGMVPLFYAQIDQVAAQEGVRFTDEMRATIYEIAKDETLIVFNDVKPQMVRLYANTLTPAEIDKSLELYESPEGRSLMAKMQQMAEAVTQILLPEMEAMGPRLAARVEAELTPLLETQPQ